MGATSLRGIPAAGVGGNPWRHRRAVNTRAWPVRFALADRRLAAQVFVAPDVVRRRIR